jgi:PKD repeat protein
MNIPQIYLIEPYNAYAPKGRKKHWMEIAEEEALMAKIIAEQSAILQTQNLALLSQTPPPTSQQVQDAAVGSAVGPGAGGIPRFSYFKEPTEQANFSFSPASPQAGTVTTFTNLSPTPENDTFLWRFGSGSLTSTDINPTVTYSKTGSYTVILQETSSTGHTSSVSNTVTVVIPTLSDTFTGTTFGLTDAGFTASFTGSVNYISTGTISGKWVFGDGQNAVYTSPITHIYGALQTYTASLQVTESLYQVTASVKDGVDPFLNRIIIIS